MFNMPGDSNPSLIAEEVAKKFIAKGYKLDFSLQSLEEEIDKIINNPDTYKEGNTELLKAELSAYVGETFCRIFDAEDPGQYFAGGDRNGVNYYSYFIEKGRERFHPSHFFDRRLPIYDFSKKHFKDYLHYQYSTIGERKIVAPGVLFQFLKTPDTLEVRNPEKVALQTSRKYGEKGYCLDFSLKSLQEEIDLILINEKTDSISEQNHILEAELTAYFGETLCRLYGFSWEGVYSYFNIGANRVTCKLMRDDIVVWPSHFFSDYLKNEKMKEDTFKEYVNELVKPF
ncbi:protein of unknown function [Tenacibaculum sp. 190130A14a]|uniref:Uncharacterized protein n=1 Tax=Tenacibaculum polynesiense TaxID=3137857 RepID=A0ABM9PGE3_9FLAO